MLKLLAFCIKVTLFSLIVLILGNWIHWDGKTISDQIKLKMSHAEKSGSIDHFKRWADQLTQDAKNGFQNRINHRTPDEYIPISEKQKLKALIRDLNSSQ